LLREYGTSPKKRFHIETIFSYIGYKRRVYEENQHWIFNHHFYLRIIGGTNVG